MRPRLLQFAAALAAIVGIVCNATSAMSDDAPTAMLIVDSSGSMWARLPPNNKAKIDIVRDKLAALLQTPSQTRVGLVAFGHRRRGDCNDVQLIASPDSPRDALIGPIAKLNPRGPGPVTAALKIAIDTIDTARPAQIVIVGDGADNCQQDTCAVATDFAKTAPGVAIQVIGIGIPASDRPRIACAAQATGGHYYDVADENGLNAALDEATKLAILSPGARSTPSAAAKSKEPVAPPPPSGATLRVSASLAKGGALLKAPLRWRIFKAGEKTAAGQTTGPDISAKLLPGSYDIEAELGSIMARQQITVANGTAESIVLPLDAAHLRVNVSAAKGGAPSPTATLTVASGNAPVAIARNGGADLYLPPADYTVTAEDGIARASQTVTLAAGDDTPVDIALGSGRVELSATNGVANGKPGDQANGLVDDVIYTIFEDDPESPDGRREVARSHAAEATFTLPSGTYYVSARSGAAEVRERIGVGIGETVKKMLVLAVAHLELSAVVAGAPATEEQGVVFRVDRIDANKERVARAVGPKAAFSLPPGRYRITASLAASPLLAVQEVTLEAGKTATTTLKIDGGFVRFKPPSTVAYASDAYWEVLNAKGVPVWRKTGTDAKALLAPGHYKVRFDAQSKKRETEFDVRAGETKEVEIGQG
ncbi:vWA domain-containing protein [Hyphomicrobium sp.]|jgi:Ca-activated chloride channel family protein|uniref:vWA domain-containing protein n=1 Tax=Hyphomicrobium sp. TaxID=82 RepID=UPI002C1D67B3|nr:VWA domain-containing protein [Hyphomicrobium sp.]HVZ05107.1 VWA domain-containing protein [Hyphomicrobium sp.]